MKKRLVAVVVGCIALLAMVIPQMNLVADEAAQTVDIMFLHDTHSHLNTFSTVEGTETVSMGGFSRI